MENKNYDSFFELFRPFIISFEDSYFEQQTKKLSRDSRQIHQRKAGARSLNRRITLCQ